MNKLKDIAQLTRLMKDPIAKRYVTDRWVKVVKLSEDEQVSKDFINALLEEKIEEISRFI